VRRNFATISIETGKKSVLHPDKLVNTGAYSAAVVCDGWLYVSGHASIDLKTGELINGNIEEQTNHNQS
jgi:2-iminobutanoate/2-iminopropanoate deaminase